MADDWFEELPDAEAIGELITPTDPTAMVLGDKEQKLELVRRTRNELLESSASIIQSALMAGDLDPLSDTEEPPPEWVQKLGYAMARKRHAIARAAWMNKKEAPAVLDLAKSVYLGILKAEGQDKAPRTLNVQIVQLNTRTRATYEEHDEADIG